MSPSYSLSGHAPDQLSMRSSLQSCLECLDRLNGRIDCIQKETLSLEILEIRARIIDLLASCQSRVTTGNSSGWDSIVDIQAMDDGESQTITPVELDELNAMTPLLTPPDLFLLLQPLAPHSQLSDKGNDPSGSVRVVGPRPESGCRLSHDLSLYDRSGLVRHELGALPFLSQHDTFSDGQTVSGCSARRDQQLPLPIMQGKVKCIWPGCFRYVKKDNLTRHVNETHRRKVKAICDGCGKGFTRPYMKKHHICPAERRIQVFNPLLPLF